MANLFTVSITQINGSPSKYPKEYAFISSDVLILENHSYPPNNAYILYNTDKYYTNATVETVINAANVDRTEVFEATIVNINGSQISTPIKGGFPIKGVLLTPDTSVSGAQCNINYKGKYYYAAETVDALVAEANSGLDPVAPVTGANPTAAVGFTAVNGNSTQFMRSDAAPAIDPAILTKTGEGNKILQMNGGGGFSLDDGTNRTDYSAAAIFMYGAPNGNWIDIDASSMEIDLLGSNGNIHIGQSDGIDTGDKPIKTTHVPADAADTINKAFFDTQIAGITTGIEYKGSWNATTNTPTLIDGTGDNGDMYQVSVAGSRDLGGGVINFEVGDHVVYVAGTLNRWENFGASQPVAANPTSKIGLTANNGTSLNFMRSDAAQALDQNIAPTWSAVHKFGAVSTPSQASVQIANTNPQLDMAATNGAVDNRRWNVAVSGAQYLLRAINDAGTTSSNAWAVTRAAAKISQQQWFVNDVQLINLLAAYLQVNVPQIGVTGTDGVKLWLAKYTGGTGHNNAPTSIGATSNYLQIGGREYGNNGYGGIGFGYVSGMGDHPCVWVGYVETNTTGNTMGDFIVGTRPVTTNTAPIIRFRIAANGDASFTGNVNVQGNLSSSANANPAGPTNSGVAIVGSPNNADIVMFDATQAVNNRTSEIIFFQGAQQFRFKNDAGSTAVTWLSATGGQAAGITGITSSSGTGNWVHTGGLKTTKETILSSGYTVATLPAASAALKGARAFVTDASVAAPTFMSAATGGGNNTVPVFCTGTAWVYA
jgi:hypothetical protein